MGRGQLAAYLGKPVKYVYRLTHERRIEHYVIGRELRFDPEHVAEFLGQAHYEVVASDAATEPPAAPGPRVGRPRRDWGNGAVAS